MKVMFDTNIYISFIRNQSHRGELQRLGSAKYLSAIVLMELWAGARSKKAQKLLRQLQRPYLTSSRIVTLTERHYITTGEFLSSLPPEHRSLSTRANFVSDVQISLTALSIGATLFTEDRVHFGIISGRMSTLKVEYLRAEDGLPERP
ncbi:MAG: type II toxin-antitoxin system VapC family toxin [Deltaproteobacteria bacterium]|nr:type II toxin-antitoxin system VapC family toxin [Deltaproteobacteria bacterium]